jgi:hypothetical protein
MYVLLIKGALWKIIVVIFGWYGMFKALETYFPHSHSTCTTILDRTILWSEIIPTIIVLLALAYTKES